MVASEPAESTNPTGISTEEFVVLTVLLAVLVAVRLPAMVGRTNLSHDATEYVDIARNIAAGSGPILKIRGYFFGDGLTLPYPAASLRSTLFPLLAAAVYSLARSDAVFQWFNLFLFCLNMGILGLILRPVMHFRLLVYSLLLIGLSEPMFLTSIFPWAEQTAFLWLLLTLLAVNRDLHRRWGPAGAAAEGLTASLAALSRPEYALVGVLALAWLLMKDKSRWQICGAFLAGFLLPLGYSYGWNYMHYGRLFFPGEYLLRSRDYSSYFAWENVNTVGAGSFVLTSWPWIFAQVLKNAANYMAKLVGWKNLFALAAAVPLVLRNALRGGDRRRQQLALLPAAFFCCYCLVWAGIDRERYLLAVTTFWLPLCLVEFNRWRERAPRRWVRILSAVVMTANLPLLTASVLHADLTARRRPAVGERFYARENPAWSNPDLEALARWIRGNAGKDDVFCLENPFLANYFTGRPAVVLPERIPARDFARFLSIYRVRYWANNSTYTKWPRERLKGLEEAIRSAGGRQLTRCGTYEIWTAP